MKRVFIIILLVCLMFIICFLFIKNTLKTEMINVDITGNAKNTNIHITNNTEIIRDNNLNVNIIESQIPENINIKNNNNLTNDIDVDIEIEPNPDEVILKIVEDSITNSSVILSITDKNERSYNWGEYYIIQKKEYDKWNNLELIREDGFIEISYKLDENDNLLQKINFSDYYGELPNGIYRVVKPIYDLKINEYINFYSNEFIIE